MKRAIFLDRDGVICRMYKYAYGWDSPQQPQDVKLVEGITEIISWANKHKIPVIEITNQPGVGLGKMSQETADAIERQIHTRLEEEGALIDKSYVCPHHPDAVITELKKVCDCRKPLPGLILQAKKELGIYLAGSIFLGDNDSDVQAAKAAGVKSIIFIHDENVPTKVKSALLANANYKVTSIESAFKTIKKYFI